MLRERRGHDPAEDFFAMDRNLWRGDDPELDPIGPNLDDRHFDVSVNDHSFAGFVC